MWSLPSAANSAALSLSVRPPQLSGELVQLVMGDGTGGGGGVQWEERFGVRKREILESQLSLYFFSFWSIDKPLAKCSGFVIVRYIFVSNFFL